MTPGSVVQIKEEWRHCYRAHGTAMAGIVHTRSPTGSIARIRLDQIADSYVLVCHLEPADVNAALGLSLLTAA